MRFLKLFYRRAYVWQFLEANGDNDSFYEARDGGSLSVMSRLSLNALRVRSAGYHWALRGAAAGVCEVREREIRRLGRASMIFTLSSFTEDGATKVKLEGATQPDTGGA